MSRIPFYNPDGKNSSSCWGNETIIEEQKKSNRIPDFTWFGQLCLRLRSCKDFINLWRKTEGYNVWWLLSLLYNKKSKTLNINMKR